jgi:hypothetical protein
MFPLRDENPPRILAWVTLVLIAANICAYFGTLAGLLLGFRMELGSRGRGPKPQTVPGL